MLIISLKLLPVAWIAWVGWIVADGLAGSAPVAQPVVRRAVAVGAAGVVAAAEMTNTILSSFRNYVWVKNTKTGFISTHVDFNKGVLSE